MNTEAVEVPEEWARAAEHAYEFTSYDKMADHAWPNVVRELYPLIAARVRAQALADAWYVVHTARWGPLHGGPDSFYAGCKEAEYRIAELPGYDKDVHVSPCAVRKNSAREASRSGKLGGDPGGVGSTNRGLTPTTEATGSES